MGFRVWFTDNAETPFEDFCGFYDCPKTFSGNSELLTAHIAQMLDHPPANLSHPLSRFWWKVKTVEPEEGTVDAVLEFVEKVDRLLGFAKPDLRRMLMRWDILTDPGDASAKRVTIRWTEAAKSEYLGPISSAMSVMTDRLLERLSSGGSANQQQNQPGGLHSKFLKASAPGFSWSQRTGGAPSSARSMRDVERKPSRRQSWPTPQDYHESVQNPQFAFPDNELSSGEPELTALGMPKVATGAFASVYRLRCHARDIAVRCFLQSINDQAYRYQQLSKYILADDLSYTVGFEFQQEGVKVSTSYFPILKMEWVDGMPLHLFIESIVFDKTKLQQLAATFRKMTADLRDGRVAHGDLQHGNILVREGELYLVDYDGMFVPSLSQEKSNELGHANYQHPARDASHFGPYLDNFSAWVIDTSLFALQIEPGLWRDNTGGDECLLFRKKDFLSPHTSPLFNRLCQHPCQELRQRSVFLAQLLDRPLDQIPWLGCDGSPSGPNEQPVTGRLAAAVANTGASSESIAHTNSCALPDWMVDREGRLEP